MTRTLYQTRFLAIFSKYSVFSTELINKHRHIYIRWLVFSWRLLNPKVFDYLDACNTICLIKQNKIKFLTLFVFLLISNVSSLICLWTYWPKYTVASDAAAHRLSLNTLFPAGTYYILPSSVYKSNYWHGLSSHLKCIYFSPSPLLWNML